MLADYHTHTHLCHHGTGRVIDYARRAREIGLAEFGASEHNPMPEHFDDWRMDLADLPEYLAQVAEARRECAPFPVRLGLECDFLPDNRSWIEHLASLAEWDYLIGSVHYIAPDWDVDNDRMLERWEQTTVEDVWQTYWGRFNACAGSGLFEILAHPDLPKKFGHRPAGDLSRFYRPAVEAVARGGAAIEISTAGLRKPVREIYPATGFLALCHEAGVPIVISSDAHAPEEVGHEFPRAVALARAAGYVETARFERRERSSAPLPLLP